MVVHALNSGPLSLRVSTKGGTILGFWADDDGERVALLRPATSDAADALSSACYPLVPFGNRIAGNSFTFEGADYLLQANTSWDPLYLHGDGWLSDWTVEELGETRVVMSFTHAGDQTPYTYKALQTFDLRPDALELTLQVENCGDAALPFGLGWHPFFPLTFGTTLAAHAKWFWSEGNGHLPAARIAIPAELDFSAPSPLPSRWVNNGFEEWDGDATIVWPQAAMSLKLSASAEVRHAFLFTPGGDDDAYFCFEPMTHLANGHHLPGLGDLRKLRRGESLTASLLMRPEPMIVSQERSDG